MISNKLKIKPKMISTPQQKATDEIKPHQKSGQAKRELMKLLTEMLQDFATYHTRAEMKKITIKTWTPIENHIESLLEKERERFVLGFVDKLEHGKLDEWDKDRGTSVLSEKKVLKYLSTKSKGEDGVK